MAPPPAQLDELLEDAPFSLRNITSPNQTLAPPPAEVRPTSAASPPALMAELVEEILLRFPPEDPSCLLRAALVCKDWCLLIRGRGFRRRFREFHRTPPVLGFVGNFKMYSRFVPTTSSSSSPVRADNRNWRAIDARHGRVLGMPRHWRFGIDPLENGFVVWDPITNEERKLPLLPASLGFLQSWNAAVLCAAHGLCDHLDCGHGHFQVVFVATNRREMLAYVYSSEADAWSEPAPAQHPHHGLSFGSTALVGDGLYFMFGLTTGILKYDLCKREVSAIHLPTDCFDGCTVLTAMEDGGLGFGIIEMSRLNLWSREVGLHGEGEWAQIRVIELKMLLPVGALLSYHDVFGFVNGAGVVFYTDG